MSDPTEPGDDFDHAANAYADGDLDRAMEMCRAILDRTPTHVEALNLYGVLLQNTGATAASIPVLEYAAGLDPEFADIHANLARGLRALGREAKAEDSAARSIELDPDLEDGWLHLGLCQIAQDRYDDGMETFRAAVSHLPDSVPLHAAMGFAAIGREDAAAAVAAWREIARLQPDRIEALINLGTAYCMLERADEALPVHARALALAPDFEDAVVAYAGTLHGCQKARELNAFCRAELLKRPGHTELLRQLVTSLVWLGRFQEANEICRTQGPGTTDPAWFQAQTLRTAERPEAAEQIAAMRVRLEDPDLPDDKRSTANYALAQALDRGGAYDEAIAAYRVANSLSMAKNEAAGKSYIHETSHEFLSTTFAEFPAGLWSRVQDLGNPSSLPVFIVGMPRSGTTLVEQIAASHSRVFGAGELRDVSRMVERLTHGRNTISPSVWDPALVRRETAAHLDVLRELGGGAARVIDKLPDNIQMLGQIRVLYPNAPIIICRRDLRDVCFSCYTLDFADRMPWSNDLAQCANRAVATYQLADYWVATLPGPIMEIQYETLVGNLEAESRRLIAFLGLDWEAECLNFHRTERVVATVSVWQVRQPLFDSSIGRWRPYAKHLEPMLSVLRGYMPPEPDDAAG